MPMAADRSSGTSRLKRKLRWRLAIVAGTPRRTTGDTPRIETPPSNPANGNRLCQSGGNAGKARNRQKAEAIADVSIWGLEKATDTMNSPASAFRWRKQPSARASCGPSVRAVRCSRASRAPALEGCLPAASASVAAHQARRGVRARWWHIAAGLSWTGQLTLSRSGTRRAFAIFALTLSGSGTRRPIAIFALTLPPVPGRRIIAVVEAVIGPSAAVGRTFIPVVGPAPILCPGRQPRIGLDQCRWGAHRCGG
jgi:hypothetical protein